MSTQFETPLAGPDPPSPSAVELPVNPAANVAITADPAESFAQEGFAKRSATGESREIARPSWATRLQELAAEHMQQAEQPPEAISWREKPPLSQRIKRGIAVPVAAAAAVFLSILLFSIVSVWLQPHGAEAIGDTSAESSPTPRGADTEVTTDSPSTLGGAESGSHAGWAPGNATIAASSIVIHVVGEVAKPGVYELPSGARALAAIEAAGGASEKAVLSALNLARQLSDGEQLLVPNAEQAAAASGIGGAGVTGGAGTTSGLAGVSGSTANSPGQLVNLNAAELSALESLPHIGPALAARIIDWRTNNGGFRSIDQILEVSGIGRKTFEDLRAHVTV